MARAQCRKTTNRLRAIETNKEDKDIPRWLVRRKTTNRLRAIETQVLHGGKDEIAQVARQLIAFGRLKRPAIALGASSQGMSQDN